MKPHFVALAIILQTFIFQPVFAQTFELKYKPTPSDNPLRGLVPYVGQGDPFPHSLEFWYFPMSKLMTGPDEFDWSDVEKKLDEIASRKCHAIIRVYMEFPTKGPATPQFLIDQGVKLTKYRNGKDVSHAPNYNDPRTRQAMKDFIAAYGKKYDGDPRVGFITMGILGKWGEWHTFPREDLWASKATQIEVMEAFEKAFTKTKVLMRYPAGDENWDKAPTYNRPFGYHDDSFAWATLDTGKKDDDWYFMRAMKLAGTTEIWKTQPIGGEIRPEVWGCVFDNPSCSPKGQEFDKCVQATHVSWLLDSGMFSYADPKPPKVRIEEAHRQIQKMGYELFVKQAKIEHADNKLLVEFTVTNRGVAPFYYDWPVRVSVDGEDGSTAAASPDWKLSKVMPGKDVQWRCEIDAVPESSQSFVIMKILNPLKNGKPFLFANESQLADGSLKLELK